jgi:predicted  nucleic acid-binding Zn-ribbon protein
MDTYKDVSNRLEMTEEELKVVRAKLRTLEQQLSSSEMKKASVESAFDKQRTLLSSMEDSLQKCRSERADLAEVACQLRLELQGMSSRSETQQVNLLRITQEREQVSI